jgi:hypothetical protein
VEVEQVWLAAGGAVALLLLVAVLVLATAVRRLGARVRVLEEAATPGVDPRADAVGSPAAVPAVPAVPAPYVITGIDGDGAAGLDGSHDADARAAQPAVVQGRIDGALFADIVAREGVIKAAGLAHGLRRALAPATRNRIRFEMKREVKRSRRQRRADLKAALRDMQARERSGEADLRDGEDAA